MRDCCRESGKSVEEVVMNVPFLDLKAQYSSIQGRDQSHDSGGFGLLRLFGRSVRREI